MSVFRKEYRQLSEDEKALIEAIKTKAEELYSEYEKKSNREAALAKTKLEESVMWIVKGITG